MPLSPREGEVSPSLPTLPPGTPSPRLPLLLCSVTTAIPAEGPSMAQYSQLPPPSKGKTLFFTSLDHKQTKNRALRPVGTWP